jgi:undecaprenyl-diphosphatase
VRRAQQAVQWTGPYPVFALTLLLGALTAVALTAASVEIYEAVAEADGAAGLDHPVLDWAVAARTPGLNAAVTAFTDLGGPVGMTVLATIATAILAVWRRSWTPVVLMTAATCGSLAMTVVGKSLVGRIRPPLAAAVAPYETSASFPSGHALNATVVAGVVAYLLVVEQRRMSARVLTLGVAVVFAVLMGLSRVFLGHHWLTDVLMAWTLALAWLVMIIVAHRLYRTIRNVRRRPTRPAAGRPPDSAS